MTTTTRHARIGGVLLWLVAAGTCALQVYGAFHRAAYDRQSDLQYYLGSVRLLADGGSLYDFVGHNVALFVYPPLAGLFMYPLGFVDGTVVAAGWTVATVAAILWISRVLARHSPILAPLTFPLAWPAAAIVLFASAAVSSNLRFGQITLFLALLVLADTFAVAPRLRGALTGAAAAIKLTPLIFIPLYWFAGRRRAAVVSVITFVGLGAAVWLVLPAESNRFWLHYLGDEARIPRLWSGGNQSLTAALLRLGVDDRNRMVIVGVVGAVVGLIALWRACRAARRDEWLTAVTVMGAASIVISPVSWQHHQLWLVFAAFLPVSVRFARNLGWMAGVIALMTLPMISWGNALPGVLGTVGGNVRLLLAIAVACAVPFRGGDHGADYPAWKAASRSPSTSNA